MRGKWLFSGLLVALVLLGSWSAPATRPVAAASEEEIALAIENGVAWLAAQQDPFSGSWGGWEYAANTCFALVKLEEYAYEKGYDTPFDPAYPYVGNVLLGWEYLFLNELYMQPIGMQTHGDPDTNGNGYGVAFGFSHETYTAGICTMALAASGTPDRPNGYGIDFDGNGFEDTFFELAQETVDWLAFAQSDSGSGEGGWYYTYLDNAGNGAEDNSNSGYAVLGLAYGEDFGCTVPQWVRDELDIWVTAVQDPVNGDPDDGGSWYRPQTLAWVNELKTGNLIFEMTFVGDTPDDVRFQDALDYIVRHWQDADTDPGWGYSVDPAAYQAMYTLMKGFEYSGIDLIDLDGDMVAEHDWFDEFATVLVAQQDPVNGNWPSCSWGDELLCTIWSLLVLEKVSPPPPQIEVPFDVHPTSCPNPINVKSRGTTPAAILGTAELDVTQIDPATVRVFNAALAEPVLVAPLRWSVADVATPYEPYIGKEGAYACTTDGMDGYSDLTLKFNTPELVGALGPVVNGQVVVLTVTANLLPEFGGTALVGEDVLRMIAK